MIRRLRCLFVSVVVLAFAGTASGQKNTDRPSDGILVDSTLQRVVDLQNARNAGALVGLLSDARPEVRARAAFALASVQDPVALQPLIARLSDDDVRVRADVAFAIGQTGVPVDGLFAGRLASETDAQVLHELMQAAGKVGAVDDLEAVRAAELPDELEGSRALAIARFGLRSVLTDAAVEHQVALLGHERQDVRETAAYYFWRTRSSGGWQAALPALVRSLEEMDRDDPAAGYLAAALAPQDDFGRIDLVTGLLASNNILVRTRAARALGDLTEHPEARSALISILGDVSPQVVVTAAGSLASLDDLFDHEAEALRALLSSDRRPAPQVGGSLLSTLARSGHAEYVIETVAAAHASAAQYAAYLPALAHAPDDAAFAQLLTAIQSEEPTVSAAAAGALVARWRALPARNPHADDYFAAFSDALARADIGLIYAIAPVLSDERFADRGSAEVLAKTFRALQPPADTEAMLAIIQSLQRINVPAARTLLEEAAGHPHDAVAAAARNALGMDATVAEASEIRRIDWEHLASLGQQPRLQLDTDAGTILIELYPDQAPQTVETITRLAAEGLYDGTPFHRVVPDFVIQGGDFERGDGFGGPGFEIRSEFTRIPFERGVAGMASAGKDTEGSQFFFTHSMQPHLDGRYTAFGRVVEGMDVVDAITQGVVIRRATLID